MRFEQKLNICLSSRYSRDLYRRYCTACWEVYLLKKISWSKIASKCKDYFPKYEPVWYLSISNQDIFLMNTFINKPYNICSSDHENTEHIIV